MGKEDLYKNYRITETATTSDPVTAAAHANRSGTPSSYHAIMELLQIDYAVNHN